MQYVQLGRTAVRVSRLCLGTMNFGPRTSESDSQRIMDRALELGLNLFDTANVYGRPVPGTTESIIGRWLAQGGGRREQVVLATKVYGSVGQQPNERGLSAYHIRRACEDSLRRLQTDHVDLYYMHHVDRSAPWDEVWQAMEQLVQQGKVLYVGSSNFAGWQIARASDTAAARHFLGLVAEQSVYSLAVRTVELEVIPACRAYGLALCPWSPLGGGLLAGRPTAEEAGRRAEARMQESFAARGQQLAAFEAVCQQLGERPADVALAWLLGNPAVTAPILGPRTLEQLDGSLRALEIELAPEVRTRLDAIWPGPGGEAPEAYAW